MSAPPGVVGKPGHFNKPFHELILDALLRLFLYCLHGPCRAARNCSSSPTTALWKPPEWPWPEWFKNYLRVWFFPGLRVDPFRNVCPRSIFLLLWVAKNYADERWTGYLRIELSVTLGYSSSFIWALLLFSRPPFLITRWRNDLRISSLVLTTGPKLLILKINTLRCWIYHGPYWWETQSIWFSTGFCSSFLFFPQVLGGF